MTGYEINGAILKKFGVLLGPSTIYSKLSTMERKGWIRTIRETPGRVYVLTNQGQKKADDIKGISKEIQNFVKILLPN
jgi:DNA-binding PadR family transcriptional regulator